MPDDPAPQLVRTIGSGGYQVTRLADVAAVRHVFDRGRFDVQVLMHGAWQTIGRLDGDKDGQAAANQAVEAIAALVWPDATTSWLTETGLRP